MRFFFFQFPFRLQKSRDVSESIGDRERTGSFSNRERAGTLLGR
jgi:hypothetical protein